MPTINGRYIDGTNIIVNNGKVFVDGEDITPEGKNITIAIEGSVDNLDVDYCNNIYINGNANTVKTTSGDVTLNEVKGNISTTSGNVKCMGDCGGSINTVSGDVKTDKIMGDVKTMSGDISKHHRKSTTSDAEPR